jgi:hypothetical protein
MATSPNRRFKVGSDGSLNSATQPLRAVSANVDNDEVFSGEELERIRSLTATSAVAANDNPSTLVEEAMSTQQPDNLAALNSVFGTQDNWDVL